MARIQVVPPEQAEGKLKEIYDGLLVSRGAIAEVHKIQSLNPETIKTHMNLYMSVMFAKSPLKRWQREMIAVIVSSSNQCTYCTRHHAEALNHYWKDDDKTQQLITDFEQLDISEKDLKLCEYARHLTLFPGEHERDDFTLKLKNAGLTEREILDATLVVAYFNFVTRIVLSLGVELESNHGKGYKY
jgi:uncharacterized peroxidase-related enzyme